MDSLGSADEDRDANSEKTYRVRLRFRVAKPFDIRSPKHHFSIGSQEIILSTCDLKTDICDEEWLVMNTYGIKSRDDAHRFANSLLLACNAASAASRIGIDCGVDLPTCSLSESIKKAVFDEGGSVIRDNVHGIDVFEDHPNVRIITINATATVRTTSNGFLTGLVEWAESSPEVSVRTSDVLLLLNYALMRPEPVAQIVFSISAVEMLGQAEKWSPAQVKLIEELKAVSLMSDIGTKSERIEVANSLEKGLHKLSLRQGVVRLLSSLNLEELKPKWDKLYSERSALVHGLAPKPGVDYSQLAYRAVSLCGKILLTYVAKEIPGADRNINMLYDA